MAGDDDQKVVPEHKKGSDTSTVSTPWESPNHSLYMHHSDQPGMILVPQALTEDNYINWADSMSMALAVKNKHGFINGTITRPLHNKEEQGQWDRCNILVKTWLFGSMSKEIKRSLAHCKTAHDIWEELKERFSHTNTVQLYNIENDINKCEQGTGTVTTYHTNLTGLWDARDVACALTPCTCEAANTYKTYIETQKTIKFLMGLNEGYASLRSNIISMDPLPSLNKVYAAALRHEKQAAVSNEKVVTTTEASTFAVKRFAKPPTEKELKCEKCGMTNHVMRNCRAHLKCTYCEGKGHTYNYCRRRKADLEKAQEVGKVNYAALSMEDDESFPLTKKECQQMMGMMSKIRSVAEKQTDEPQMLEMLQTSQPSANLVGKTPNYQDFSGPSIGEDDWDGN
uniref:uncharacterized protein LOC101293529 isoform X1 n=1 Tax=Fragaria vesca subsp. vesca TaxID=101020 RepID=UPI0005C97B43|nr:PREDICTED: uncharacterized protein LOC101293529 isoform X1 [Fragaria vesca subsp. vesca]